MSALLSRGQFVLCSALFVAVALHLLSLCIFVRFYGPSYVLEYGDGFAIAYWGGDEEARNSCVYNAGEWPLRPETHFGGSYLAEGQRWELYGPGLQLDRRFFSERMRHRGLLPALGYSLPQYRMGGAAASMLLPLGGIALIAEAGALMWLFMPSKPASGSSAIARLFHALRLVKVS